MNGTVQNFILGLALLLINEDIVGMLLKTPKI